MDQDMPHRISAPSRAANGAPRYSLVWKMVWFDRADVTLPDTARKGGPAGPGNEAVRGNPRKRREPPGLCRPEWGTPLMLGQHCGQPAWAN